MKKLFTFLAILLFSNLSFSQWSLSRNFSGAETAMWVQNKDSVYVASYNYGYIYQTFNGGQTWETKQTIFNYSWFLSIHFPTNEVGYACGGTAFGPHRTMIAKTIDGGVTWDSLTSNQFSSYDLNHVYFANKDTGFVSLDIDGMMRTKNGGATFERIETNGMKVSSLVITPNGTIYVGAKGSTPVPEETTYSILRSVDLGNTWTTVHSDTQFNSEPSNNRELRKIFFVNDNLGYAVGGSGLLMKTVDAGLNWTSRFISPYSNLTGIHFLNENLGYINNAGGIYKTTDGGDNWVGQNMFPLAIIDGIQFATEEIGYAFGMDGIFKTENGGDFVGLSEMNTTQFSVHPNPVEDILHINSSVEPNSIKVYNQLGELVILSANKEVSLNVNFLNSGIYFLELEHSTGIETHKFIKL